MYYSNYFYRRRNIMYNLDGRIAMVTGASSGLGASAAVAYAKSGADVALVARRKDRLEETAKEIEALGRKALVVEADVTKEAAVKSAVDTIIDEFGRIDILLNAAGMANRGGVHNMSLEDWDRIMDVNVKGIFLVSKYVIPHMKEEKYGKVINISSINAVLVEKGDLMMKHGYNTSKAAVMGLTRAMAASYGEDNITVNSVNPGLFKTEMTQDSLFKVDKFLEAYKRDAPLGRAANEGELNGPILFLSSEASSYVTGQHLFVDGGRSIT